MTLYVQNDEKMVYEVEMKVQQASVQYGIFGKVVYG